MKGDTGAMGSPGAQGGKGDAGKPGLPGERLHRWATALKALPFSLGAEPVRVDNILMSRIHCRFGWISWNQR